MPNPFTNRLHTRSWEWPVAVVCLLLGSMISLGWIKEKNRQERSQYLDPEIKRRLNDELLNVSKEVSDLRAKNTKLEEAMGTSSKQTAVLNESLQQAKLFAGLTEVEGPGVTITLRDGEREEILSSDRSIHDVDLLRVVNELWASGAEAIEVNGHRVVSSTSFRCVGPVIHVQGVPIAPPIHVRAIGDPDTLMGGLNLPDGILDELRQVDKSMVQIDRVARHRFKAFTGNTALDTATTTKENK